MVYVFLKEYYIYIYIYIYCWNHFDLINSSYMLNI